MENRRPVLCPENEDLANYMWKTRQEMAERNAASDRIDSTIYKAYANVCASKDPITSLKELSQVKGVGKWTLRIMKGFFPEVSACTLSKDATDEGKKTKGSKRYVPRKNSVAYALLITLYRAFSSGSSYMLKQQLIDAAEASGLSGVPIAPEKSNGKRTQLGSSPREWYSGWSCMKTLITKGLIVKSSCPAKYMLTEEGRETACECLSRSGLAHSLETASNNCMPSSQGVQNMPAIIIGQSFSRQAENLRLKGSIKSISSIDMPVDTIGKYSSDHHSEDEVTLIKISEPFPAKRKKTMISTGKMVSPSSNAFDYQLQELVTFSNLDSGRDFEQTGTIGEDTDATKFVYGEQRHDLESSSSDDSISRSFGGFHPCSLSVCHLDRTLQGPGDGNKCETIESKLAMPPRRMGEKFEDVYDVILILDNREQFVRSNRRHHSKNFIENTCKQFNVKVEVRRLPVGDGLWIARHKYLDKEFVLDFIVERKEVDDLYGSIKDNRYRDQKLRLLRCGIQKLIYVVEGDPNSCEASENIKTACFTTEILEGFDVQRTSCLTDTLKKYCYLTSTISKYYKEIFYEASEDSKICLLYDEFVQKCHYLDKMTASDVFGVQLMQVPQVTEEVANAVLDLYPTLLSLARAYSLIEGDIQAQEDMLRNQNGMITAPASRNIFKLVWGSWSQTDNKLV